MLLHKSKRFTIYGKLVLIFIIVISPLYMLGVYINEKGAQIVTNEISESLKQQTHYNLLLFENEIARTSALQIEFMNDKDLMELSVLLGRMSMYARGEAMKQIQAKLKLIAESSIYIARAKAYIPSIERVISSNEPVDKLEQGTLDQMKEDLNEYISPFVHRDQTMFIREYYPNPYTLEDSNPNFILELEVSNLALDLYMDSLSSYEGSGAFMVHADDPIVSDQYKPLYLKIWNEVNKYIPEELSINNGELDVDSIRLSIDSQNYFVQYAYSTFLNSFMIVYLPESNVIGPIQHYRNYLWIISIISLIIIITFSYWIYRIIHQPLHKLVKAFKKVELGNLQVSISHKSTDEFYYLYDQFNSMIERLSKLITEVYEQKIHVQQSELKQLQSQINPHFLYNSFYLLYRMTKAKDFENATRYTMFLGNYYQYLTRNGKQDVKLSEEFKHVKAYTEIQSIRSNGRLKVTMDEIPEDLKDIIVPRLILQPIVENAYKHGFNQDLENYHLIITLTEETTEEDALLIITVKDNGVGMTNKELCRLDKKLSNNQDAHEVTGMINIHQRLQLKYGGKAGIKLQSSDRGLTVKIIIPF